MSHGVHAVQHEVEHHIEHEEHGHGGRGKPVGESRNKKIALLISVIALFLALAEMFGKSAQTEGISLNIKASDTWNFFQAKTIRQTSAAHRRPGFDRSKPSSPTSPAKRRY